MSGPCRIDLVPLGERIEVEYGAPLEDALFPFGVEFPCGGAGICCGCRVRVLQGSIATTPAMVEAFSPEELAAGWRLACCARVEGALSLEIAQWETPILADYSTFSFEATEGLGVAVDVGTTTLVAQLLDLASGEVLAVQTALNPQTIRGADVMSRIQFALTGSGELTTLIRDSIGNLIAGLVTAPKAPDKRLREVILAGNTVMHHLFGGIDVAPLSHVPFQPVSDGMLVFGPRELGWNLDGSPVIRFLSCLGGFVGSDILAGILAVGIPESDSLVALMDLGTNGEIVVGNRQRMLCASTAAGPAFEAGRIRMGMRAAPGAIAHAAACNGSIRCRVLGHTPARGICGSGLVAAVAAGLELGRILPSGRLAQSATELPLDPPVTLTQNDIRELQLAKAAIAAGLRILLEKWGGRIQDLSTLYLAGAFGNYVDIAAARRIGLLEVADRQVTPVGNAALRGAKMALLSPSSRDERVEQVLRCVEHVPLASNPHFQDVFVECMSLEQS